MPILSKFWKNGTIDFILHTTLLSFSLNVKWFQFWYSRYNATLWYRHCYLQHKEVLAEKSVSNRSNLSLRGICCARIESCILLLQIVEKCILCCHVTSIFVYLQRDCLHIFSAAKFLWLCKNVESLIDSDTLLLKRSQTYW